LQNLVSDPLGILLAGTTREYFGPPGTPPSINLLNCPESIARPNFAMLLRAREIAVVLCVRWRAVTGERNVPISTEIW
jgi:hypothetical protein